jgi:23S rRNA (pseudouridine1915-N3)-methyltransferase
MRVSLAVITGRRAQANDPFAAMQRFYIDRAAKYIPTALEVFASETALLAHLEQKKGRTPPALFLLDSRGRQLSSEELAADLSRVQDAGVQQLIVAVGPADGWSDTARKRADVVIAFGRVTLPHELAAVIAAEQIYRALTILAGHPYHSGH